MVSTPPPLIQTDKRFRCVLSGTRLISPLLDVRNEFSYRATRRNIESVCGCALICAFAGARFWLGVLAGVCVDVLVCLFVCVSVRGLCSHVCVGLYAMRVFWRRVYVGVCVHLSVCPFLPSLIQSVHVRIFAFASLFASVGLMVCVCV